MKMIVNGKKVDAANGSVIEIRNPATGEVLDTVPNATKADIDLAVSTAKEAQKQWAKVPVYRRAEILMKFVALAEARKEEIGRLLCQETGKPIGEAMGEAGEISVAFSAYVEKYKHLYGNLIQDGLEKNIEGQLVMTIREPVGVVTCIVPFNYPITLFNHKVAPALIAGNSAIVKPSEFNPLTLCMIVDLLVQAGVPDGVVQIVTGSGAETGRWLCEHPDVHLINFTGSTATGIKVYTSGAQHLAHVALELGGNDAFIVCEDGDVDLAVEEVVVGRISNAGQICIGSKRILVHNAIRQDFTEKLVQRFKRIKQGDPLDPANDVGCLINVAAAIKVEAQVQTTLEQGAKLLFGGGRNGAFYEPTILVDVPKTADVASDMEIFGPVVPIFGFDSVEDAIVLANQSSFGLGGCVFSRDIKTAMKVAAEVNTGSMNINGSTLFRSYEMPFGGNKKSGIGREGVSVSFDEVTQIKTIVLRNIWN